MMTYIANSNHYKELLSRVQSVKHMLWIGTADINGLYVNVGKEKKPIFSSCCSAYSAWGGGEAHSCQRAGQKKKT